MLRYQEQLRLSDARGREVFVRKRGTTAPGLFVIRRKGNRAYLEFKYYVRGTGLPQSLHIGAIERIE